MGAPSEVLTGITTARGGDNRHLGPSWLCPLALQMHGT